MKARYGISALAFLLLLFSGLSLVSADGYFVSMTPLASPAPQCSTDQFFIPVHVSFSLPDNLVTLPATTVIRVNGLQVFNDRTDVTGWSGSDDFDSFEGASSPDPGFPAVLPYTYQSTQTYVLNGIPLSALTVSFSCDAGGHIQNPTVSTVQFTPANLPAPPLPSDFVLRTIVCDTPLYESAGGQPVSGGAAVTSGQTWYVNPVPVDAGAASWTELFDSSYHNGWLPTSCVGGAPAGY